MSSTQSDSQKTRFDRDYAEMSVEEICSAYEAILDRLAGAGTA